LRDNWVRVVRWRQRLTGSSADELKISSDYSGDFAFAVVAELADAPA